MKKKILVFGGSGLVGSRFIDLNKNVFEILAPDISEIDILNRDQVGKILEEFAPDVVINFAAYTNVEEAEKQKDDKNGICFRINALGVKNVAGTCKKANVHLIHISTDYVFDGEKAESPYTERDIPNPINWYGKTKHFGDQFVLESACPSTIVRISMPYSAHYDLKGDVARFFLRLLKEKNKISTIADQNITPTLVDDIAQALVTIVNTKPIGIYHVASTNHTTPLKFAKLIAQTFNLDQTLITPITLEEYNKKKLAKLLKFSWLDPSKFEKEFGKGILHTVEEEVKLFKSQII